MYFVLYPLNYLRLRDEDGFLVLWRDVFPTTIIVILCILFFQVVMGANFYGKDGFVEKVGGVTSSLTGFYIAGLLAVATFTVSKSALDQPIKIGPVFLGAGERRYGLSRREYVCLMFGYLSMLSLTYSISAAFVSSGAAAIHRGLVGKTISFGHRYIDIDVMVSLIGKMVFSALIVHLSITTGYGLYYLIKKIYEKEPVLGKKAD